MSKKTKESETIVQISGDNCSILISGKELKLIISALELHAKCNGSRDIRDIPETLKLANALGEI